MKKKKYSTPMVLKKVPVVLDSPILAGSIISEIPEVKTTGQENGGVYDFSSSNSFNHSWGE